MLNANTWAILESRSIAFSILGSKPGQRACADLDALGYKASDIMQSNCIIWVEGPSDRIYLRHWISALEPNLIEGTHYTIMFYGGRLLSHLSADDPEIEDFISLRRLNRNIAILIDSDKDNPRKRLNKTKIRVREEFDNSLGFAWITKGREIENYIDRDLIKEAIRALHNDVYSVIPAGPNDHALLFKNKKGTIKVADKIKVAYYVSTKDPFLDILDLKNMIYKTVDFIIRANKI